jgi:hypothetical protein
MIRYGLEPGGSSDQVDRQVKIDRCSRCYQGFTQVSLCYDS